MICPPYLEEGSCVAIVAPARKITLKEISEGVEVLQSWGLRVVFSKNLFEKDNQFAGTDDQRAEDFQKAIDNPDIKAIFCARGGYGSVKIIDNIDFSPLLSYPKWIVGFSDITVFHSKLNTLGIETIHAPVVSTLHEASKETLINLKNALFGEALRYNIICENENIVNIAVECTGELCGGNLSILYSLMASNCEMDFKDKILFIEDVDEYLYHVDRMMNTLKRAGKLSELKALIVGDFSRMNDNTIPFGKTAKQIIYDTVKDYNYPVCFNFPSGHIADNHPLILGRIISLSINKSLIDIEFHPKKNTKKQPKERNRIINLALVTLIFFAAIWVAYKILLLLIQKVS